jgi:hypothetical protein
MQVEAPAAAEQGKGVHQARPVDHTHVPIRSATHLELGAVKLHRLLLPLPQRPLDGPLAPSGARCCAAARCRQPVAAGDGLAGQARRARGFCGGLWVCGLWDEVHTR